MKGKLEYQKILFQHLFQSIGQNKSALVLEEHVTKGNEDISTYQQLVFLAPWPLKYKKKHCYI
jgi:hypothetical protein